MCSSVSLLSSHYIEDSYRHRCSTLPWLRGPGVTEVLEQASELWLPVDSCCVLLHCSLLCAQPTVTRNPHTSLCPS